MKVNEYRYKEGHSDMKVFTSLSKVAIFKWNIFSLMPLRVDPSRRDSLPEPSCEKLTKL